MRRFTRTSEEITETPDRKSITTRSQGKDKKGRSNDENPFDVLADHDAEEDGSLGAVLSLPGDDKGEVNTSEGRDGTSEEVSRTTTSSKQSELERKKREFFEPKGDLKKKKSTANKATLGGETKNSNESKEEERIEGEGQPKVGADAGGWGRVRDGTQSDRPTVLKSDHLR